MDATTGIIGRNAQVVTAVHKAMLENGFHSAFDPLIPPLPWNEKVNAIQYYKKHLKIFKLDSNLLTIADI